MHDNPNTHVSSAKQLYELDKKREEDALRDEASANKATHIENVKIELLKEANDLALKAHIEAQESKIESEKSSKRALWANVIAVVSLLVAITSLIFNYV